MDFANGCLAAKSGDTLPNQLKKQSCATLLYFELYIICTLPIPVHLRPDHLVFPLPYDAQLNWFKGFQKVHLECSLPLWYLLHSVRQFYTFEACFRVEYITEALDRLVQIAEINNNKMCAKYHIDFTTVAVLHGHYTCLVNAMAHFICGAWYVCHLETLPSTLPFFP